MFFRLHYIPKGKVNRMKKLLVSLLMLICCAAFCAEKYGTPIKYELIKMQDGCRALEIAKGYLYSAGRKNLSVYDISNPRKPKLVYTLKNIGSGRQMAHKGDYLYVTKRGDGITIINIKDPAKPKVCGFFDTIEMATGCSIAGNLLFCAQRIYGVETLDISDPEHPRTVSIQRTHEAQSSIYKNGYLYVGDWGASFLTVVDMKDPVNPRIVSKKPLDGYGDGVDVDDKYCYAATGHHSRNKNRKARHGAGHGLEIYSLKDPAKPSLVSRIKFPPFHMTGNDFWTVRVSGNTAVVADTHNGVFTVDITDRKKPVITGQALFPEKKYGKVMRPDCSSDLELGKGVAYVSVYNTGLAVIPVNGVTFSKPQPNFTAKTKAAAPKEIPGWKKYDFGATVRRVSIKEDTAYVSASVKGLHVLDLKSGKTIQHLPFACAYDTSYKNGKLYCAAGDDGIVTYQINADNTLTEIARHKNFSFNGRKFSLRPQMLLAPSTGNFLAVSDRSNFIFFFDITDPQNMKLVARDQWIRLLYGDSLPNDDINGILPVHYCGFGTLWFDLNGDVPKVIARVENQKNLSGQSEGWSIYNGKFFAPSFYGYTLLDAAVCGKGFKKYGARKGFGGSVTIDGNVGVFANRRSGVVKVFDFSDIQNPVELKKFHLTINGNPDRARFWNGHIVVPAGLDGLLISEEKVK